MTSSVFFKFKSQKEPSRVEFDGTGISVFELKRDIIIKSGLGDGTDFDLAIYNEDGSEEYDDDTTIIPRSTTIIARRLPPLKPGAGRAARYMSGKMPVTAKNNSRKEQSSQPPKPSNGVNGNTKAESAMTEEERMAAMFQAQTENWSAQQAEMANQTPVFRPGGNRKGKGNDGPDHEPPPGYVCYRCNETGHWIKNCPTNDNPEFDNKPRVKRTTGIPKSFLKEVEKPTGINDGTVDDTKQHGSVMLTAEGKYVTFEPNHKDWEKFQAKTKSSAAAQKAADLGDIEVRERGLECSIDQRMFIDPMKTPCCEKTYCNDCITNALIEGDLVCPGCQSENILIDDLKPDTEVAQKITAYLQEKNAAKKERSKSPSVKAEPEDSAGKKSKSLSPTPKSPTTAPESKDKSPKREIASPKSDTKNSTSANTLTALNGNKKRPADELLENPKIPKGPKAMQQQEAQKQALKQQQLAAQQMAMMNMNPMAGFPNMSSMPFNPMAAMNGMNGAMNGMGMNGFAFPGMSMPMMNMGNTAMMNPMMSGFPGFGGMGMGGAANMAGFTNGNVMGMGNSGGNGNSNMNRGGAMGGGGGRFQNQQRTVFSEPLGNEEDNAYFRQPVNPHRHQGKQRRARPSDYREV